MILHSNEAWTCRTCNCSNTFTLSPEWKQSCSAKGSVSRFLLHTTRFNLNMWRTTRSLTWGACGDVELEDDDRWKEQSDNESDAVPALMEEALLLSSCVMLNITPPVMFRTTWRGCQSLCCSLRSVWSPFCHRTLYRIQILLPFPLTFPFPHAPSASVCPSLLQCPSSYIPLPLHVSC